MTRRAVVLDPRNPVDRTLVTCVLGAHALRWNAEEIVARHRFGPVTDDPIYVIGGRLHARRYRCGPDGKVLVLGDDTVVVPVSKKIPLDVQRMWQRQRAK